MDTTGGADTTNVMPLLVRTHPRVDAHHNLLTKCHIMHDPVGGPLNPFFGGRAEVNSASRPSVTLMKYSSNVSSL